MNNYIVVMSIPVSNITNARQWANRIVDPVNRYGLTGASARVIDVYKETADNNDLLGQAADGVVEREKRREKDLPDSPEIRKSIIDDISGKTD
jgi:hypothetical protein